MVYWVVVRRLGFYENNNLTVWNDQEIAERGPDPSLIDKMRSTVREFLERPKIADFILGMVILLCVVIFSELALAQQIEQVEVLGDIYYIINYILLTFFIIEIAIKLFAYGHLFLMEFINVFDSVIVIVSYVMLILNLKVKVVGILRVLRLIKVIINLKRVSDEKRAQKEFIKEQKRQGSQMASYVERVLDYLERLTKNENVDKTLREDVEWAIDMISANKLYTGTLDSLGLQDHLPEVQAWKNLIFMKKIPINMVEDEKLKAVQDKPADKKQPPGIQVRAAKVDRQANQNGISLHEAAMQHMASPNNLNGQPVKKSKDFDDSKSQLLSGKVHPLSDGNAGGKANVVDSQESDSDEEHEFLELCDLVDVDKHLLDNTLEKIEETTFDAFNLCTVAPGHGIQFMMYKICYMYNFYKNFNFSITRLIGFTTEIANGYF